MRAGRMNPAVRLILSTALLTDTVLAGTGAPCPTTRRETRDGCAMPNRDSPAVWGGKENGGKA